MPRLTCCLILALVVLVVDASKSSVEEHGVAQNLSASEGPSHILLYGLYALSFVIFGGFLALVIINALNTDENTVYAPVKRPTKVNSQESVVSNSSNQESSEGEGGSSDNEPRSETSLLYAPNQFHEEPRMSWGERFSQILSIPVVFIIAVFIFIAVIAVSTTVLSFVTQNQLVDSLTGELQDSISKAFISQTNQTMNDIAAWGLQVRAFSDNYIAPHAPLPLNNISIYAYKPIFNFLLNTMLYRNKGSGFGIKFPNGKGFGGGNEIWGVDMYDTYNFTGVPTIYVSILPPDAKTYDTIPQPDLGAQYIFPAPYDPSVAGNCVNRPLEYWAPLVPTQINATRIEGSLYRYLLTCDGEDIRYSVTIFVKFNLIAGRLQQISQQIQGKAFIAERNGAFISSTTDDLPFNQTSPGVIERIYSHNSSQAYIREAWAIYQKNSNMKTRDVYNIDGVNYFILVSEYKTEDGGIDWIVITLAESDPYLRQLQIYLRKMGLIIGIVCAVAVVVGVLASFWITKPFGKLSRQLQRAAKMQLTDNEDMSVPFLFEAKRLHQSFITMRDAMKSFQKYIPDALVSTRMDYKHLRNLVEVGSGAYGVVFRAEWGPDLVAVKQVKAETLTDNQMQEFLAEISVLQRMKPHPNVVLFMAATFPPQPLSMVTEFCGMGSLYSYSRKNELPVKEKVRLLLEIAKGMHHLHKQKIIHRDLALRNILLTNKMEAKVSDFGLSRVNGAGDGSTTTNNVGPLKWMSPEAITENRYSTKSDSFSFGVVIWELIEVSDPHPGLTAVEAAFQVVNGLRLTFTDCPLVWLSRLAYGCWENSPKDRPSFKDICDAISNEGVPNAKEVDDIECVSITLQAEDDIKKPVNEVGGFVRSISDAQKVQCMEVIQSDLGAQVWTGSYNGNILIRDAKSGDLISRHQVPGRNREEDVITCMLRVGQNVWCGSSDGSIAVVHIETGKCVAHIQAHSGNINALILTDQYVWSGAGDRTIKAWDPQTGASKKVISGHSNWVRCLGYYQGKIWSGSDDTSIRVWDEESGELEQEIHGHSGGVLCMIVVGRQVWTGSADKTFIAWDAQSYREIKQIHGHNGWVTCLLYASGMIWTGSSDKTIRIWNAKNGNLIKVLPGHIGWVWCLQAVGFHVWSGSSDKSIRIWLNMSPGQIHRPVSPVDYHSPQGIRREGRKSLDSSFSTSPMRYSPKKSPLPAMYSSPIHDHPDTPHSAKQLQFIARQLEAENEQLLKRLKEFEATFQKMEEQVSASADVMEQQAATNTQLEESLLQSEKELNQLQNDHTKLEEEHEAMTSNQRDLELKMKETKVRHEEEIRNLQREIEESQQKLESANQDLMNERKTRIEEQERLQRKLDNIHAEVAAERERRISSAQELQHRLDSANQFLSTERTHTMEEQDKLQKKLGNTHDDMLTERNRRLTAEQALAELQEKYNHLHTQYTQTKSVNSHPPGTYHPTSYSALNTSSPLQDQTQDDRQAMMEDLTEQMKEDLELSFRLLEKKTNMKRPSTGSFEPERKQLRWSIQRPSREKESAIEQQC
ncbi:hypothetical protein PROFUN_10120 [Planoprotostelium fungivorum]|uniref:Protein kinase domain-containing protein n=1 Tax=Planoprotostelium fungivorum TaxID=1890364 RepID=A0A2P6NEN7_9EUKA|nr:hypothetical protein PROFUN_10120 [Planoprotostelium fungivorum]